MLSLKHKGQNCKIDTLDLKKELSLPLVSNQQQDAEEFLTVLINKNESLDVLS